MIVVMIAYFGRLMWKYKLSLMMKFFILVMIMIVFEENPIHDITAAMKSTVNAVWSGSLKVR